MIRFLTAVATKYWRQLQLIALMVAHQRLKIGICRIELSKQLILASLKPVVICIDLATIRIQILNLNKPIDEEVQ
jgi:hypothetical protein